MSFVHHAFHIVFSTKNRAPLIDRKLKQLLYEYMGGIIRKEQGRLIAIGGVEDHVHILCQLHQSSTLADVIRHIKSGSSRWVNQEQSPKDHFTWQTKYGSFSVSHSQEEKVKQYIHHQEEHHRAQTFQDEFLALLEKHGMTYDERYVWE